MTNIAVNVSGITHGDFILASVEEHGKFPEWAPEAAKEAIVKRVCASLTPTQRYEGFKEVFRQIEKAYEEALTSDSIPEWYKSFAVCVNEGPLNNLINYMANVYPEVDREIVAKMLEPQMYLIRDVPFMNHIWTTARDCIKAAGNVKGGIQDARNAMLMLGLSTAEVPVLPDEVVEHIRLQFRYAVQLIDATQFQWHCEDILEEFFENDYEAMGKFQ